MAWSNKADRQKLTVEKSHSFSFAVRVEDRLHVSILQPGDTLSFTVRPVSFKVGQNDTDITVGTAVTPGNGIRVDATRRGTGETEVFVVAVQAAMTNLDPELEYWYDVTYMRDGYSLSVLAGDFEVAANVSNKGVASTFIGSGTVHNIIATVDDRTLITVSSSMPMPAAGAPGNGSYVVAAALSTTIGANTTVPLASISAPQSRPVQVGDVIFSSTTAGVLAVISSISLSGTPSATITTRQVFGKDALKALLDTSFHTVNPPGIGIEIVDSSWTLAKTVVPLPAGYDYRVGDMVMSHSGAGISAMTKKLLISLVTAVGSTTLTLQTKIVFPMYINDADIADLLAAYVPSVRQVNTKALSADITLTQDDVPDGTTFKKYAATDKSKLGALPTAAVLTTSLAAKSDTAHTHTTAQVGGLDAALAARPTSATITVLWVGTQAQYDAIATKLASTLYFIKE